MAIACYCDHCNYLFKSNMVDFFGGTGSITFTNCGESCPRCGNMANILDGTYSLYNGILELVKGSDLTKSLAKRLFDSSIDAIKNEVAPETWLDNITKIDDNLGKKIKNLFEADMKTQASYGVIILFILLLGGFLGGIASELGKQTVIAYQEHHK